MYALGQPDRKCFHGSTIAPVSHQLWCILGSAGVVGSAIDARALQAIEMLVEARRE
jgi:hypothetical protein